MPNDLVLDHDELPEKIQAAGVAGAGGAGFPSCAKWIDLDGVHHLLVNHQESEPNYYADKWLGREHADDLVDFLSALLDSYLDVIVVGTKEKYRDEWTGAFETACDASIYESEDLPVPVETDSGVAFAYTPDVYTYSEESVLLMVTAGVQIGEDLPTDHGWIVHNTETLYNIARAVTDGTPVTRKYVHVHGDIPHHRCLEVPIGTTASALLETAGAKDGEIADDQILADGGPGWCYEIDVSPDKFGVRKRTNAVLVLDRDFAANHLKEDGQIDVLEALDWEADADDHETEPTLLEPDLVRIPLITNAAYEGFVELSEPTVEADDPVSEGDVIATPAPDAISNTQHASIDGTVTKVTDTHIVIER